MLKLMDYAQIFYLTGPMDNFCLLDMSGTVWPAESIALDKKHRFR